MYLGLISSVPNFQFYQNDLCTIMDHFDEIISSETELIGWTLKVYDNNHNLVLKKKKILKAHKSEST